MSEHATPAHLPKLDLSLGAIEIGVLVSTLLYGMTAVQSYTYFASSAPDRMWLKCFVAAVTALETGHTAFIWVYLYNMTVTNFGNPHVIAGLPWYFAMSLVMQGTVSTLVQMFYTYRVYKISRKMWLAIPALLGELLRVCVSIIVSGLAWKKGNLPDYRKSYDYLVYVILITASVVDVWNTAALCFYLRSRQTAFTNTISVINDIVLWAVETGVITTATAIVTVICWGTMPENALWACLLIIYAKLFSNSVLVSLNTRTSFRDRSEVGATNTSTGSHVTPSTAGINVTRSYNVEISHLDGSKTSDHVPMDDLEYKRTHGYGAVV